MRKRMVQEKGFKDAMFLHLQQEGTGHVDVYNKVRNERKKQSIFSCPVVEQLNGSLLCTKQSSKHWDIAPSKISQVPKPSSHRYNKKDTFR